jgi:ribosomal protein S18 acetylase RimI-like enzyme
MLTDVVGELLEWTDGVLRIRRRDGSIAEVAEDRLVAGKAVPPPPVRQAQATAHVAIDQLDLEQIASRGWLGLESRWMGRWLLRASEGFTGRGNSVLPLGDPGLALDAALGEVAQWYGDRGLPGRFQMPLPVMYRLDDAVATRGWRAYDLTHVMTGSVAALRELVPARNDLPPVEYSDRVSDEWMTLYHYRGRELPPIARTVLGAADHPVFASVRDGGQVIAIVRGALASGWLGVTALEVLPSARRRGLGSHVMRGLADWAAEHGAGSIYLQVDTANEVAVRFYDRLGFYRHHQYQYRLAPGH